MAVLSVAWTIELHPSLFFYSVFSIGDTNRKNVPLHDHWIFGCSWDNCFYN